MPSSGDVGFRLAEVLAKAAAAFLFPIPAVAVGIGELAAWYIEHAASPKERRTVKHIVADLEQIAEDVAKKTLDQFGHEFRGLPENERNAAILAVTDTFSRHPVTRELAMRTNLSGPDLAELLKNMDALILQRRVVTDCGVAA